MLFDDSGLVARKDSRPGDLAKIPEWLNLPDPKPFRPKRKYRTVWISDIHLGPLPDFPLRKLFSKRITGYVNWRRNRIHLSLRSEGLRES